jgi:hypothetical protein
MPALLSHHPTTARHRAIGVALAAFTAVALAACASSAQVLPNTGNRVPAPGAAGAPAATQAPSEEEASKGSGRNLGDGTTNPADPNAAPRDSALIVKTGTMTIETDDVGAALLKARADVIRLGGYISGSEQSRSGDDRITASVTYRFPSDRWEAVLDALKERGELKDEKTDSLEVTGQVVDLDARIANLRATERALQAIMQKATRIPDILEVQNHLTQVQGEIEALAGQVARLRDQAALSTLTVIFQMPPAPVVKETSKGWSAGVEFDRALALLLSIGQGLVTVGIWLAIVVLPLALGFGLLIAILAILGRRFGRWPTGPAGPPAMAAGPDA